MSKQEIYVQLKVEKKISLDSKDKEQKFRSHETHIDSFEKGFIWRDIDIVLQKRLQDNFMSFMSFDLTNDQLRTLQGSTVELYALYDLPDMLRRGILEQNEEKKNNARRDN